MCQSCDFEFINCPQCEAINVILPGAIAQCGTCGKKYKAYYADDKDGEVE